MARRRDARALSKHRAYTVDEAARALGVCRRTIRRWISHGMPAFVEKRPTLIHGADLIAYLRSRRRRSQACKPNEFYCFSCRAPRRAAFSHAEIASRTHRTANLRALCEECATLMHKRVSVAQMDTVRRLLDVRGEQAPERLSEREPARSNVHYLYTR